MVMKVDDIKKLMELMSKHDVCEIDLEEKGSKVVIKRAGGVAVPMPMVSTPAVMAMAPAPVVPAAAPAAASAPAVPPVSAVATIDSPLVGTFYASPAPGAESFVKDGTKVTAETVVCIIEAMKVMNEIKAEKNGVIRKVLASNGKPVQFGQPLFEIDPA